MCGRYVIISPPEAMRRLFGYTDQPNFPPRYNVAPTQAIPLVRLAGGVRRFALSRWGLIPAWVRDPRDFALLINARAESVNEKPAFRNAMRYRRCLIPADGFYEWQGEGVRRRAYFLCRKDRRPFAFAGLWESWMGPNGEEIESAAIVTTQASPSIAHIHHRMPVMLAPEAFAPWLDCAQVDAQSALSFLTPLPDEQLELRPVSAAVNRVANDDPSLLVKDDTPPSAPGPPRKRQARAKTDAQASLF